MKSCYKSAMGFTRYRRSLTAWLALFALALNSAWPLVAKASAGDQGGLTDICTVAGMQPATDRAGHSKPLDLAASHCAFCSFASAKAIFTSHSVLPAFSSGPDGAPAGVDFRAPTVSSLTLHAAPRAPPFHS
jgi:Protein of unknown function (DUF2946)